MDNNERIHLQKMINENNVEDCTYEIRAKKHSNKIITISILKPIPSGLLKEEFIKILESNIYEELNILN